MAEDKPKALEYWRLAAQGGDDLAQFHLASAYCDGEGTGRDLAEAARWFRLAADQGLSTAQLNLGLILLGAGDGGREEAKRYLGLAADLGLAAAREALDGLEAGTDAPRPCGP
ncbi:MAG: hypothetical protein LBP92_13650 [Deltaproteobacteria bacterium]|nr:hypothetical protein [Deltaproteobacteria bacterium]